MADFGQTCPICWADDTSEEATNQRAAGFSLPNQQTPTVDSNPQTSAQVSQLASDHDATDGGTLNSDQVDAALKLTKTSCQHYFHERCLAKWLEGHSTCPMCRNELKGGETSRPVEAQGVSTTAEVRSIFQEPLTSVKLVAYVLSLAAIFLIGLRVAMVLHFT